MAARVHLFVLLLGCFAFGRAGPVTYRNPILPGFHPDPSVCRVGDDYYLVTSTFEWFPGVPVYHSKDLGHWELIGHVLDRPSNLNLDDVECSGGIYAPTLRYHDGTYYLITTLVGAHEPHGNFIVTAKDPAGPWSDPHWIEGAQGIDPSLFFDDDGKAYYCGNGRPRTLVQEKHRLIWIQELDLTTMKLVGPKGELDSARYFESKTLGPVNNFEGPHLYKKDGAYYLMLSHGGTSRNHAVSIWRGRSPLGPFTAENPANPIVTHRGDHPRDLTCTGHADLVQTQQGEWWMVLLGVRAETGRTVMGRETFLVPVDWSGVWPVVNPHGRKGRVELELRAPNLPDFPARPTPPRDEFAAAALGRDWTFIRTPRATWWDLQARPGWLTLAVRPAALTDKANPSFVGRRVEQAASSAATLIDFMPNTATERAGLAIMRARDAVFEIAVEGVGPRQVAVYENGRRTATAPLANAGPVRLGLDLAGDRLVFRYAQRDEPWRELGGTDAHVLMTAEGGRFTGTFVGLFATSAGAASAAVAAFDWFELRGE